MKNEVKKYMVKTMDNGTVERRYYATLNHAMRFFNACGSAVIYEYDERTFCYEYKDAR